ncbi:acyloxyacyl hydrolase [Anoplophora glabripennis]|nr:acyloxyacyl hydrolase [Anoplophora glabripennis]
MKIILVAICMPLTILPLVQCRGVNGGMSCAVCTVLTGVAMQVAEIHEESLVNATIRLCNYLPKFAQDECLEIVTKIETIADNLSHRITPDVFCLLYGTCNVDTGQPLCHLFPLPFLEEEAVLVIEKLKNDASTLLPKIDVCELPVIDDICRILNNSYTSLDAAADFDSDGFSTITPARGADWKGRDCMDNDPNAHPGRTPYDLDIIYDSNCNGIYGIDNKTKISWEELLCTDSDPKGIIYIGDSIGAHFHMPQVWINPIEFDWPSLNASDVILDELDWPQFGFVTGYKHIPPNILIKGPTDSLYMRLRKRNRCNHRDYQNLSQNGASSYDGVVHANAVSRNQSTDNPAIVFYAMQGNDVCNNLKDTTTSMTDPVKFRSNVMDALKVLNGKLPKKSHVILIGLVDADFIYDAMAERLHPIGVLHKNVHYKDMYNWFICMQIGPCNGWLNPDELTRQLTSQRADELTNVLKDIAENEKFDFFDLHFIKNPINEVMARNKINVPDLLEAVDSLHPNQKAQPILTEEVWSSIIKDLPLNVLGSINKNNKLIKSLFGDQGGH